MKRFLFAAALVIITVPVLAADVGVSVNIGQPGFYGRIDIGNYPQPQLIYPAHIMVQPNANGHGTSTDLSARASRPPEKLAQALSKV